MKPLFAVLVLFGGVGSSHAVTSIFDNFNDGVIDTAKWQVLLPFGNSQVVENSGYVYSLSSGILGTLDDVDNNIRFTGKVMLGSNSTSTRINLRSDLLAWNGSDERTGITISFGRDGFSGTDYINITGRWSDGSSEVLGVGAFPDVNNTWQGNIYYNLQINDVENNIEVLINDVSVISTFSSQRMGNKIGMRGFYTQFDDILIQGVPEPSSLSLLLAGGAVLTAGRRRNS